MRAVFKALGALGLISILGIHPAMAEKQASLRLEESLEQ